MALGSRASQHNFAKTPDVRRPRSQFNRSYTRKDTAYFDYLNPIMVQEVLPGDTFNVKLHAFTRMATQLVPLMDNAYMDYHFFFVPNRLVWTNWERFNGAQDDPGDSTDYLVPTIPMPVGGPAVGTLGDKFGIPSGAQITGSFNVNSLPFRGHNLIWNDWFRDENLQNSIVVDKDDGPDTYTDYILKKRGKRHDYFTSSLPEPQKGPDVTIPLGTTAPVVSTNSNLTFTVPGDIANAQLVTGTAPQRVFPSGMTLNNIGVRWGDQTGLETDLTDATAATINQLRESFQMQALFELDMRGGTRYVEILKAHFGVISPDFRLQRPEYLGGGSTRINSHPVAQTAEGATTPAGNLTAFATQSVNGNIGFSKSFVEHGYIIGFVSARADLTYQQGLDRKWSRSTRYDFYWPTLSALGEQEVLNKEIFIQGTSADSNVFGYQERYAEYRYQPSEICGQFRSDYAQSLDQWHMAQDFATLPSLNASFIESNTPVSRVLANTNEVHLLMDMYFEMTCARAMPVYSVPAQLGRF